MSSESDSDVFFDAEDNTPTRTIRSKIKDENFKQPLNAANSSVKNATGVLHLSVLKPNENDLKEAERKAKDNEKRRKKVEELRKQMLNDDDEVLEIHSEQSSVASSFDGIYPQRNYIIPRKIDSNSEDMHSVISLGKVGSILGGKDSNLSTSKDVDAISTDSKYSTDRQNVKDVSNGSAIPKPTCLEPDVVASTKGEQFPVPPPRKKKNRKPQTSTASSKTSESSELPSPTDPVESLAREFEHSLDLRSATKGQYVVKPQDREQDRAEGPTSSSSLGAMPLRSESLNSITSKNSLQLSAITSDSTKKSSEEATPCIVRTRSDSGRPLTDQEILAQVSVRNLDTGEQIPLSLAEEHLPKCLNPLSLHIMRLTSEYVSNTALDKERESDEESIDMRKPEDSSRAWMNARDLRRRLKLEVNRIKTVVDRVTHPRHGDEEGSEDEVSDMKSSLKIKISSKLKSSDKGSSEFDSICVVQELIGEHTGAVWTMKFSSCGRLLATAGQDHDLRIWVIKDAYTYFNDMRQKFSNDGKSSPTPSQDSSNHGAATPEDVDASDNKGPFMSKPFCRYKGHTAELLDVSWSKNYFILSSSMDKTVRLWHISRKECLCCFQHIDFVTAIAFHPRDDRYFLSGSLDGKLRLWNIPDKKVTLWNELDGQTKLITAVNFCQNGKIAVVGSYDGRCIFYTTDQLKYHTQIHVRSTKGKNAQGRKISGIEAMPGEDKILVTSNDSRIRLYDLRDLSLTCKFKGYANLSSQIKASFSHDGKYIISGSENQFIYIWKTSHDCTKFRRDRNDYWTGIKAHNAVVTSAVFAPNPVQILQQLEKEQDDETKTVSEHNTNNCYVMVSADFSGIIKVFLHKTKTGSTVS